MKKIRLTESDLTNIVKKVIEESPLMLGSDNEGPKRPSKKEKEMVKAFKRQIINTLGSGGTGWSVTNSNPSLEILISGIRRVCDEFESYM